MPEPDEFLTVADVAALLKVNQQTVRNWIDAGTMPAVRIGRRVRIKRSDFDAVVQANYSDPPAAPVAGIWDGDIPAPESMS